jgi:ABC-type phosphate transport system substrate-binding protein
MAAKLFWRFAVAVLLAWSAPAAPGPEQAALAVIVAKNGPDQALDKAALARIFLRKTLLWANHEPIQPVNLSASHPLRRLFSERVSGLEPEELEDYWNDQYFHGVFPPYSVASEEAAIRYVSESPAAIGYVSACAADARVKILLYLTASGSAPGAARFCPPR